MSTGTFATKVFFRMKRISLWFLFFIGRNDVMKVAIIDGQGGGIGKLITEKLMKAAGGKG
jgi:hypothetical protein